RSRLVGSVPPILPDPIALRLSRFGPLARLGGRHGEKSRADSRTDRWVGDGIGAPRGDGGWTTTSERVGDAGPHARHGHDRLAADPGAAWLFRHPAVARPAQYVQSPPGHPVELTAFGDPL